MIPNRNNDNDHGSSSSSITNKHTISVDSADSKKNSTTRSLSYQLFNNRRFNKSNNGKLLEPVVSVVTGLKSDNNAQTNSMATNSITTAANDMIKPINKPPDCLANVLDKVKPMKRIDDK